MNRDTEQFIQLYECLDCNNHFTEHEIVAIKTRCGQVVLRCPNPCCHTENIRCIGDNRGG